jgi:hypothetical protein
MSFGFRCIFRGARRMGQRDQIDDLCDARAEVRALRVELDKRRLAFRDARAELRTATERLEDVLNQIEQGQGRLPFPEEQAAEARPAAAAVDGSNGRRRKSAAAAARA